MSKEIRLCPECNSIIRHDFTNHGMVYRCRNAKCSTNEVEKPEDEYARMD